MSYAALFFLSFTVALSGALAPGPLLASVIYESNRRGFKSGPLIVAGHALAEAGMIFLIVFGAVNFIRNPVALRSISVAGALILFFFGIKMAVSRKSVYDGRNTRPSATGCRTMRGQNLILSGLGVSIANPYWSIWWLTAGLGIITASQRQGWLTIAVFFAGHILADLAWYSAVSLAVSKGGKFLPAGFLAALNRILGVLLIGFAFWLLLNCLGLK